MRVGVRLATPPFACGRHTLAAGELRAFARGQLAAYKVPKYVSVVEDFPRTAAGKIQKHFLRRSLAGKS